MQKWILSVLVLVILGGLGYAYLKPTEKVVRPETGTYSNSELGIEFSYPTGPMGYVIEEQTPSDAEKKLVQTITLIKTTDKENMETNPPVGGEAPAVIAIHVLKNNNKQFPLGIAEENIAYSTYNLKQPGTEQETVVGGANALRYKADGLYASNNIVVAHGSYGYIFTGQYMDAKSTMVDDFEAIVASIKFIPSDKEADAPTSPATSGKININAVCEGALAYMSFPDGASADKFVAECKEGKHPEVIEKFKADMGLGDGANI